MVKKYDDRRGRRSSRRKGWRAYAVPLLLVVVVAGGGLWFTSLPEPAPVASAAPSGAADGQPKERTAALPPLSLPADEGLHQSGMEWWYYSGILDAQAGRRYAFHVAVFVANGLVKHTVMHAALMDLRTGKRHVQQSRTGGLPARGVPSGFDFRQSGWQVSAAGHSHTVRIALDGAAIALDLAQTGPLVLHRAAGSETPGLLDFGASGISYYYSRPRLPARGEVVVDGVRVPVSGMAWFDHQWGDFDVLNLGWNWLGLHLADGSDLMLYQLFDAQGRKVMTAGTVSDANGSTPLGPDDAVLTPTRSWTSPRTKIRYNVEWTLKLPSGALNIQPFFADAEFDAGATTANVYWEGPVKASGRSTSGEGFLELSGYDRLAARAGRN